MTDTDFDKATERPWKVRHSNDFSGDVGITADGLPNVLAETFAAIRDRNERSLEEASANAALIVTAVNSFDPERERKVEALVSACEPLAKYGKVWIERFPKNGDLGLEGGSEHEAFMTKQDFAALIEALHSLKGGENG